MPELIVKPSTLSGWNRFLKGEGAVENVGAKIWDDIVVQGKKGIKEVLSANYKSIDDYLLSTEYAQKVQVDYAKYLAKGKTLR